MNQGHSLTHTETRGFVLNPVSHLHRISGHDAKEEREREVFLVLPKGLLAPFCSGDIGLLFNLQACLLHGCKGSAGMLGQAPTSQQEEGALFALPVH